MCRVTLLKSREIKWMRHAYLNPSSGTLKEIKILENESFDPADYVKWEPTWIVERDWGVYS